MKAFVVKGIGFAVVISIMMNCSPLLGGMITSLFGRFEVLADSIICYDENGNLQLNGQGADDMLTTLGTQADTYNKVVGGKAQEFLNNTVEEAETPEDALAEFEELKTKAKGVLNEINDLGELFIK